MSEALPRGTFSGVKGIEFGLPAKWRAMQGVFGTLPREVISDDFVKENRQVEAVFNIQFSED